MPTFLWKYLLFTVICAGGMVTCLAVNYIFNMPFVQFFGLGFVIAGVLAMVWLTFKMKPMFSGKGGSVEKTWRSYPKR